MSTGAMAAPAAPARRSTTSLLGRVGRGIGALSLSTVVTAAGQVIIVPVALTAWGQARYGEWVLITGFVTFLRLTDMGLQTYVVNRFGASYARGDLDDVRGALHSTLRVQLPLVAVLLLVIALGLLAFPAERMLGVRTIGGISLDLVLFLMAAELLIGIPMGLVGGIYRATGHLARAAVIGTGQQAAVVALTLALIAARASFVDVALARVAVPVAATLYILYDLHRLHPWLRIWPSTGSWREGARMVGPGLFFLLIPAADYLSNQVVLLILQQHLHGGEVSRFATHRTVVNLAQMVSNLLISAVWFEMTALHARDEGDRLAQVQRRMVAINVWLVGAATVGMLPFIGGLYPGWTAGKLSLDWITFGLLIARVVVWSVWNASATVLWATNRHRMGAFALLGAGVVSCALGLVLVPVMGIRGGALATLVGDLVLPAWLIPRLAARQTGGSAWRVVGDAAAAFAVGIAIPALLAWGAWSLVPSPLVRFGLVLPLAAGLAATLMWRHLSAAERALLQGIVRTKLRFPSFPNT